MSLEIEKDEQRDNQILRLQYPDTIMPGFASVLGFRPLLASVTSVVRSFRKQRLEVQPTDMMFDEARAEPPIASFGDDALHAHLSNAIMIGPGPRPQAPLACRTEQTPNQTKLHDLMPGSPMPSGVPDNASCHSSSRFHAGNPSTEASADGKTPAPCSLRDARGNPSLQPTQTTACESPRICDIASADAHTTAATALSEPAAPNQGSSEPSSGAAVIDAAEEPNDSLSAADFHDLNTSSPTSLSENAFPHVCTIPPLWPQGCGDAHALDARSESSVTDSHVSVTHASSVAHESTEVLPMPPKVDPEVTDTRTAPAPATAEATATPNALSGDDGLPPRVLAQANRCYRWSDDITCSTQLVLPPGVASDIGLESPCNARAELAEGTEGSENESPCNARDELAEGIEGS